MLSGKHPQFRGANYKASLKIATTAQAEKPSPLS
jgi:hypothetical protein